MKKALYLILSATLVLGLVGCGSKEVAEEEVAEEEIIEEEVQEEELLEEEIEDEETEAEAEVDDEIEEEAESDDGISVTDYSATMYANTSANVRAGNSTDYEVVGTLSLNAEVSITGKCDNGWYRIDYNGAVAYISSKVVSESKTEVGSAAVTTDSGLAATAVTSGSSTGTTSSEESTTASATGGNTYNDAISNFNENDVVMMVYNECLAQNLTYNTSLDTGSAKKSITFEANSGCFVADGKSFSSMEAMAAYLTQFITAGATSEFYIITTQYGITSGMIVGGTVYGGNQYVIISLWWN